MSDDEKLRQLQEAELEILTEVARYCDRKRITYYLAFGTLLGAIRHQGFIPWDDDIDLFMKREDCNRFLAEAGRELPDWLNIRTFHNTELGKETFSFQAKVESRKHFVVRDVGGKPVKQRIWIDLFTLDGMPENRLLRKLHYENITFHYHLCRIAGTAAGYRKKTMKSRKRVIQKKLIELTHIRKILKPEKTYQALTDVLARYPFEKGREVIGYAYAYRDRTIVPRACFGKGKEVLFEGRMFRVPDQPEVLLRSWYGDFMKLPPENRRIPRHCLDVITEPAEIRAETPPKPPEEDVAR